VIETYVTIHDQDILIQLEAAERYKELSYTYLFVGPRPIDRVPDDVKIIVAREHDPNFEQWPHFYDFTGWYVLARHGLFTANNALCIQYDMYISDPQVPMNCDRWLTDEPGPIAFCAGHKQAHNWMLLLPGFEQTFRAAMATKGINQDTWPEFNEWPTTQGTAWRADDLTKFMLWFEPLFDFFAPDTWAGHHAERCVKSWCMDVGLTERYMHGAIVHEHQDCHGTCALMGGQIDVHSTRAATFGR
jgi:hypothetical protein